MADPIPATAAPLDAASARKVYVETFGCQMNVADTEVVTAILTREPIRRDPKGG